MRFRFGSLTASARALASILLILAIAAIPAAAQLMSGTAMSASRPRALQIEVVVTGKNNQFIKDLRPSNFEIAEDGVPQKIESFDHYHAENSEPDANLEATLREFILNSRADAEKLRPLLRTHRLILLFFDLTALSNAQLHRSVTASVEFVRTQMSAADLVAVMSFGAEYTINANFTTKKDVLESALTSLIPLKDSTSRPSAVVTCPATARYCAIITPQSAGYDFEIPKNSPAMLLLIVNRLSDLPGRSSLLYFIGDASGTNGNDALNLYASEPFGIIPTVSFYGVDLREPTSEHKEAATDQTDPSAAHVMSLQDSRKMLTGFAHDTGGDMFTDFSDFKAVFQRIQQDAQDYYLLSYEAPDDGGKCTFPKVTVDLKDLPEARISYRSKQSEREFPAPGNIKVLLGYHHCLDVGFDSAVGRIAKAGGVEMMYDIGEDAGNYTDPHCVSCGWTEGEVWRQEQIVNGHKAVFILTVKHKSSIVKQMVDGRPVFNSVDTSTKMLIVSFPESYANFYATIQTDAQMADMLLMLSTYRALLPEP